MERLTIKKDFILKRILKSKGLFILLMLSPMIIHLAIFWFGVHVESVVLAFIDGETGEFSFINFAFIFDNLFHAENTGGIIIESIRNTMIFWLIGMGVIPIHLFFSYMIYKKMSGYKFIRLALYMPNMISNLMMAIMYQQLLMTDGPVIYLLNDVLNMNIPTPLIMEFPILEIVVFDIWISVGANLIIWMGAMGRIPIDLLETGELDGISPFKEFTKIIFPLIFPTFTTIITLNFIGFLSSSGSILYFTEGNYGTNTLSFWLWDVVYKGRANEYGVAAAMGLLMTIVTIPLVVFGRMFINKFGGEVEY